METLDGFNLDIAYEQAYCLVGEANRFGEDRQTNETLIDLTHLALLYDFPEQWIIDMLSDGCESNIEENVTYYIRH